MPRKAQGDEEMRDSEDSSAGGSSKARQGGSAGKRAAGASKRKQGVQDDTWPPEDKAWIPKKPRASPQRGGAAQDAKEAGEDSQPRILPIQLSEMDPTERLGNLIHRCGFKAVPVTPPDDEESSLFHSLWHLLSQDQSLLQARGLHGIDFKEGSARVKSLIRDFISKNNVVVNFASGHTHQSGNPAWRDLQAASDLFRVSLSVYTDSDAAQPVEIVSEAMFSECFFLCACLGAGQSQSIHDGDEEDSKAFFFPLEMLSSTSVPGGEVSVPYGEVAEDASSNDGTIEAGPAGMTEPSKWWKCEKCAKNRVPPWDILKSSDPTKFKCELMASSESKKRIGERDCEDVNIWLRAYNFFKNFEDRQRQFFHPRTDDEERQNDYADITLLFLAVQALGGINDVKQWGLLKRIGKDLLHYTSTNKDKNPSRVVEVLYHSIFKTTNSGGKDLETTLLENHDVRSMIKRRKDEILDILLPASDKAAIKKLKKIQLVTEDVLHAPQEALTFEHPAREPYLAEHVVSLLLLGKAVVGASLEGSKGGWTPVLERLQNVLQGDAGGIDRKMVFVGDTNSGKSFTLDQIMYGSEMDISKYMKGDREPLSESAGVQWANTVRDSANRGRLGGAKEYVVEAYPKNADEETGFEEYLRGSDDDGPLSASVVEDLMGKSNSAFLLPIGNTGDSTSSCPVSIKRAARYQVGLVYETTKEFKQRWAMQLDDDDDDTQQRIIDEMMLAAGISEEEASAWRKSVSGEPSAINLENCKEVAGVLDKILVFSGSGNDARADRMLMRRILHHVQGKEERDLDAMDTNSPSPLHKLLDFRTKVAENWAKETSVALKRIYIHVPCQIAPSLDAELVDAPGSGDPDPIKCARMREELENADAVIAVCQQNLGMSQLLSNDALLEVEEGDSRDFKCKVMRKLFGTSEVPAEPDASMFRMAFLHNHERLQALPSAPDCLGDCGCQSCQNLQKLAEGAEMKSMNALKKNVKKSSPHINMENVQVFCARPFINEFKRALREADVETWKKCQTDMKRCNMFGVLGLIELFQLSATWPCVEAVLRDLGTDAAGNQGVIAELESVLEDLSSKMYVEPGGKKDAKSSSIKKEEEKKRLSIRQSVFDKSEDGLLNPIRTQLQSNLNCTSFGLDNAASHEFANEIFAKLCQKTKKMSTEVLMYNIDFETTNPNLASKPRSLPKDLKIMNKLKDLPIQLKLELPDLTQTVDRFMTSVLGDDEKRIEKEDLTNLRAAVCSEVDRALESLSKEFHTKLKKGGGLWAIFEGAWKDTCLKIVEGASSDEERHNLFKERFIQTRDGVEVHLLTTFLDRLRGVGKELLFGKSDGGDAGAQGEEGGEGLKSLFQTFQDKLVGTYKPGAPRKVGRKMGSLNKPFVVDAARLLTGGLNDKMMEVKAHVDFLNTTINSLKQFRQSLTLAKTKLQPNPNNKKIIAEEIGRKQAMCFAHQRLLESFNPETADRVNIFNSSAPAKDSTVSQKGAPDDKYYDLLTPNLLRELQEHKFSSAVAVKREMEVLTKSFGFAKLKDDSWTQSKGPSSADHVLTIYARKLGHTHIKNTHKTQLRNLIQTFALESKDVQLMGLGNDDVMDYCKSMRKSHPDVKALCLLSGNSGRALNIYVPGKPRPLRYNPSFEENDGPPCADAIAYLGVKDGKPMWADMNSKGSQVSVLASPEEPGVNVQPLPSSAPSRNAEAMMGEEDSAGDGQVASDHIAGNETPCGDDTESEDESEPDLEQLKRMGTRVSAYDEQIFAVGDWKGPDHNADYIRRKDSKKMSDEKFIETQKNFAQFSERFLFLQCDPIKFEHRRQRGWDGTVVEDAYAQTDNMIAVFDGTGESQYWSGKFARHMAGFCREESSRSLTNVGPGEQNRSLTILTEAFKKAEKKMSRFERVEQDKFRLKKPLLYPGIDAKKMLFPHHGSSTAVVLSLVQKRLHASECGDSLWALLRPSGVAPFAFDCIYMAERRHLPKPKNCSKNKASCHCEKCFKGDIPEQLYHDGRCGEDRMDEFVNARTVNSDFEVKEGDVVVAASDGLWDNLAKGQAGLKSALVDLANDAVGKSSQPRQQPFIQLLGHNIVNADSVRKRHKKPSGKPDDLTVLVARITFELLSDGSTPKAATHHCFNGDDRQCTENVNRDGCAVYVRSCPLPG